MKKVIIAALLLFSVSILVSQERKGYHQYTSIKEAMKHPDSVEFLDLRSKRLLRFPKEILKMKNLKILYLNAHDRSTTEPVKRRKQRRFERYQRKHPEEKIDPNFFGSPFNSILGPYKKNLFRKIPKEIQTLTHLQVLDISHTNLSKSMVIKLYGWLPNCDILSMYEFELIEDGFLTPEGRRKSK